MSDLRALADKIDLHELAERLGLERPGGRGGLYRSPSHTDSSPSLSIYDKSGRQRWQDHSRDHGGDAIDLVSYTLGLSTPDAIEWLRSSYGIPAPKRDAPREPQTLAEGIASRCAAQAAEQPQAITDYLRGRGITESVIAQAIKRRTLGYSTWTSNTKQPGQPGYGGPGVAFMVRRLAGDRGVAGVDTRYFDPALNGGVKSRRLPGDSSADPWHAGDGLKGHTIVLVESAINALSVLSCELPGWSALAVRSIHHAPKYDWRLLRGKKVLLCFDNDQPDEHNKRAGPAAAWGLYGQLCTLGVAVFLVDQGDWEHNDINDILQHDGADTLRQCLRRLEPWAIPGVRGDDKAPGKPRVFLPAHDYRVYWRYRCKEDHVSYVAKFEGGPDEDDRNEEFEDLCGFRVAQISRIRVASPESILSEKTVQVDAELFAVVTQDPYHGNHLQRHIAKFNQLQRPDWWGRCGPIFKPPQFLRLVSILGRSAELSTTQAVNFVGLCWRDGALTVSEAADCFFADPEKQCAYHDLIFSRNPTCDARQVLIACRDTFSHDAVLRLVIWALGAHLKAVLGFWPHMSLQARKGSGKTTMLDAVTPLLGIKTFSSAMLESGFRRMTAVNGTSQPVAWEEISTARDRDRAAAVSLLQQCYTKGHTLYGSERLSMLHSAPVLLTGEEVHVESLIGKMVRVSLREQGELISPSVPAFPMRAWLDWLALQPVDSLRQRYADAVSWAQGQCLAAPTDPGARRMVMNYAAVALAWRLLSEFAGLEERGWQVLPELMREMNLHISETEARREPWCWIIEIILAEIAAGRYPYPFTIEEPVLDEFALVIRPSHIMHHIRSSPGLRDVWDGLPIKSAQSLKSQLHDAGVVYLRQVGDSQTDRFDATINGRRESHLIGLRLDVLSRFGLHVPLPSGEVYD